MSQQFYTYVYRDPSRPHDGVAEPIYVGKGQKLRAWDHLKRVDNHPLTNRVRKMASKSVNPEIEIINALDEKHAHFLEECLITVIGRKDLGLGPLLNLTDGGEGCSGRVVSDVERANKREMKKQKWAENYDQYRATMKIAQNRPEVKARASVIQKLAQNRPEVNAKRSKSKSRACTVDGVNFFKSRKDLIAALGSGMAGRRSPTFKYIQRESAC